MYGMEVSFKVSALKNKIFISWLVVVLVLYVYKHYRHIMTAVSYTHLTLPTKLEV